MLKKLKKIPIYIEVFAVTVLMSIVLMTLSALIPREAIRDNMLSSSEMLCERKVFFEIWSGIPASKIDRYADSILLNIAYHYDSGDTLRSVMISEYYYLFWQNENENFRDAVRGDFPANQQYLRYWHGMAVPIRLMHLFTDIKGMYIINGEIMAVLTGLLLFLLIKNKLYAGAAGILCGFAACAVWFVPLSLEYTAVFILALIMSVIAVPLALRGKTDVLLKIFMVCGMLTCFFDFLTCETLTLLLPLLLTVYIRRKATAPAKENIVYSIKACVLWGFGYVSMWAVKWLLAAAVLGEDVTPYIAGKLTERIGDTMGMGVAEVMFGGVWRNFCDLFPVGLGGIGIAATVVTALGIIAVFIVFRKKGADVRSILLYAGLGLVPYIRYIAIFNHSYLHHFFTYRAQAATILALALIMSEAVGFRRSANALKKRTNA